VACRKITIDPKTGEIIAIGPTSHVPPAMAAFSLLSAVADSRLRRRFEWFTEVRENLPDRPQPKPEDSADEP